MIHCEYCPILTLAGISDLTLRSQPARGTHTLELSLATVNTVAHIAGIGDTPNHWLPAVSTLQVDMRVFLYSAVSSPLDRSNRFTLHPWQTCSFRHQHCGHTAIITLRLFNRISNAVYSQILLYKFG